MRLIHSIGLLSAPLAGPVIYKAVRASELQLLPHTAPGMGSLLSNNTAANGPEPAISLPEDYTHTLCTTATVRLHLYPFPPGGSPYGLFICPKKKHFRSPIAD